MTEAARARPPATLEAGLFLVTAGVLVVFFPLSSSPYASPKLVVLLLGVVLVALGRPPIDGAVGVAALVWVAVLAAATLLGQDPLWGLMGAEGQDTGLLLLAAAAALLCVGTGLPRDLADRVPGWLAWAGVAIGILAVMQRYVDIGTTAWELGSRGSTLGQPVLLGGAMAVAVAAASRLPRPAHRWAVCLACGSGLALSANRSGWIGAVLAVGWVLLRTREYRRHLLHLALPVVLALASWTVLDAVTEPSSPTTAAGRFTEVTEGTSARARPYVWSATLRGSLDAPLLGHGPGTTWGVFLSSVTPREIREATDRGWGDAHNIVVESLATTGALGTLALLALFAVCILRWRRGPRTHPWAEAAVLALGVHHLLQPLSVALTPLLFLLAGVAIGPPRTHSRLRPAPIAAVVLAVLALVVGGARLTSSVAEQIGGRDDAPTALRVALRVDPARVGTARRLAMRLAQDARAGHPDAGSEARLVAAAAVERHSWHPGVRLAAADVESLLGDLPGAQRWLERHLEVFPNDPLAVAGAARVALLQDSYHEAERLALRALKLQPSSDLAQRVLDAARSGR